MVAYENIFVTFDSHKSLFDSWVGYITWTDELTNNKEHSCAQVNKRMHYIYSKIKSKINIELNKMVLLTSDT